MFLRRLFKLDNSPKVYIENNKIYFKKEFFLIGYKEPVDMISFEMIKEMYWESEPIYRGNLHAHSLIIKLKNNNSIINIGVRSRREIKFLKELFSHSKIHLHVKEIMKSESLFLMIYPKVKYNDLDYSEIMQLNPTGVFKKNNEKNRIT